MIKSFFSRVPGPISGLMLGVLGLGNLLVTYSTSVKFICGVIGISILALLTIKFLIYPLETLSDMKIPILASVAGTFPMSLMLISAYLFPYLEDAALIMWLFAIALQILMVIYFTREFFRNLTIDDVYASFFITYVGLVMGSVTSPVFDRTDIGIVLFWVGLVLYVPLLLVISYRYLTNRDIVDQYRPLFCIMTAPPNLCLAGYISSATSHSLYVIVPLAILGTLIYLIVLTRLPSFLKLKFYPSYSSFTFPFVITALAMTLTHNVLIGMGYDIPWLEYLAVIETVIATAMVSYVLVRYIIYLFSPYVGKERKLVNN